MDWCPCLGWAALLKKSGSALKMLHKTTGAIKLDKQNHFIYLLLCTLLNTSCIRQQGCIIKLSTELFV